MTDEPRTTVDIDGHKVDADKVDLFFNQHDGSRVTDEEWDESKRRQAEAEALGDDAVTWQSIDDYEAAQAEGGDGS